MAGRDVLLQEADPMQIHAFLFHPTLLEAKPLQLAPLDFSLQFIVGSNH